MDAKMMATPSLPLELIERIVDFAGRESARTCILVSRQFHAGALCNIYRSQSVYLQASCDVLSKKYRRLFGAEDQFLVGGNRGRHVRLLYIYMGNRPRFWNNQHLESEGIILQIMRAFLRLAALQKLYVLGGDDDYKWESIPVKVREGIQNLFESPGLVHLSLQEVHGFPADILHGNKALRTIDLTRCGDVTNVSERAVIVPEVTILRSLSSGPVRNGLLMPRLRELTGYHSCVEQRQDTWVRVGYAQETIKRIHIVDDEDTDNNAVMAPALPINLKLNNFPELLHLDYSYEGESWATAAGFPLLCNIIPFFETSVPVTQFNTLRLQLSLDQWDGDLGEEFWLERKGLVTTDRSWDVLDTVLASGCYPKLHNVYIYLKIFNSMLQKLDVEILWDAYPHYTGEKKGVAADIRHTILRHFDKVRACGVNVVVEVHADF